MSRDSDVANTIVKLHDGAAVTIGQVADVQQCVTMDAKEAGNLIYVVGQTKNEMGGSHFGLVHAIDGGQVPRVNAEVAKQTFAAMHSAISTGCSKTSRAANSSWGFRGCSSTPT